MVESTLMYLMQSQAFINVAFLSSVLFFSYFGVGGLFLIADLTGRPHWMMKYKTQSLDVSKVYMKDVVKVLRQLSVNAFVIHLPFMVLYYHIQVWRGCDLSFRVPELATFIKNSVLCIIIEEIVFYYGHRLLHSNFMYKRYHKMHHEFTAPFGLVSAYAHPVEFATSNLATVMTGPIIVGSDVITTAILICVSVTVTIIHHSGYHLPLLPSPEFHDYHHLKFVGNYGVLGILDWLHGTDKQFRKSKQYKRHKVIFSHREMLKGRRH